MNKIFAILLSLQLMIAPIEARADAGAAAYVKALSSMALGSSGSVALMACNFAWSTTLFSVASIAMIAGDILLAKDYTEYQKKKKAEIKVKVDDFKNENGDIQKEVIDQRLDMENQELKHIKRRKTLHLAIGTVLLAATILGIIENIQSYAAVPNPLYIAKGDCTGSTLKTMTLGVNKLVQMAWSAASSAGGASSGAGKLFTYLQLAMTLASSYITTAMNSVMSSGVGRAIFFGANSVLVFWVAADLGSRQSIVQENISKLKKVVANVKSTETTDGLVVTTPTDYESQDVKNTQVQGNIKLLAQGVAPKSCLSIQTSGSSFGESSCATAIKVPEIKFPQGINPLIANVAGNLVSATNDLTNGDMDSADIKLAGIAAQAARMKDLLATTQKDYNERLKAENKPAINFDDSINKQVSSLQNSVGSAMGASPASIAALPAAGSAQVSATPAPVASAPITTAAAPAAPEMDMGIGGVTTEEMPMETSAPTASLDDSLGQYESTVQDISKKSDVSIFKQVSNRYLLNYTRIFKEKKRIEGASP
jgi:hypothetical protein